MSSFFLMDYGGLHPDEQVVQVVTTAEGAGAGGSGDGGT